MKSTVLLMTIILVLLLSQGFVSFAEEQNSSQDSYERYSVIYERNIFSKDRRPPREDRARSVRTTQVLAIYILRGTAVETSEKAAFVEEQISGETMRAKIGTEILNGRITDIKFNQVTFEDGSGIRHIRVGGEFGKTESTVTKTVSEDAPQPQPAAKPAEPTPSSGDSESDVLKRLMERRQSELGQ